MGAKTKKFTDTLSSQIADCALQVLAVMNTSKKLPPIHAACHDAEQRLTARHEFFMPGGSRKPGSEEAVSNDAIYRAVSAEIDTLNDKFMEACSAKQDAQTELKKALQTLKNTTKAFDAYIQKKKKSWTGKKSIPAAELAIKNAEGYIADCLPLLA